ncbi:MAG: hypothetical protein P4L27_09880 [Ignavibacteriaceae bacterium]|nr:hypothetical protein [Ignavibacteriaceae bacterium]
MVIKQSLQSLTSVFKYIALLFFFMLSLNGCRSSILDDPSTMIDYQVPEDSHVKLTIENNYNTIIATLVNKDQSVKYWHRL